MKSIILVCIFLPCGLFAKVISDSFYSDEGQWIKASNTNCLVWNSFPKTNETVTWSGEIQDGKACGNGILQWFVDGDLSSRYEGDMLKGKFHGEGIIYFEGITCAGEWAGGRYTSLTLNKSFPDGSSYVGAHTNGIPHGIGVMVFPNGNEYKGNFKFGEREGLGEENLIGGGKYVGEYKNGLFQGQGTCYYPSGDMVTGIWSNSVLADIGDYTTAGGEVFRVQMVDGELKRIHPFGDK